MLNFKPFIDKYGTFIDGQLSTVYQLLESRLIPECDDDLIRIAYNFARHSDIPMENLLRAVADYSGFFDQISGHAPEILELVNQVLLKSAHAFRGEQQGDSEHGNLVRHYAAELFNLGEVMLVEAAKTLTDGNGVDEQTINAGALVCQLIIQVGIILTLVLLFDYQ